jgi:hypothetical protein
MSEDRDWPAVAAILVLAPTYICLSFMKGNAMLMLLSYALFGALCFVAGALVARKNLSKVETVVKDVEKV